MAGSSALCWAPGAGLSPLCPGLPEGEGTAKGSRDERPGLREGGRREIYPFALLRGLPDRQHLLGPGTLSAPRRLDGSARTSLSSGLCSRAFIARGGGGTLWAALRAVPPPGPAPDPAGARARPGLPRALPPPPPPCPQGCPQAAACAKGRSGALLREGRAPWRDRDGTDGTGRGGERRGARALHPSIIHPSLQCAG